MSVQNNITGGESVVLERPAAGGVYASLFEKINLSPVSELSALDIWQDAQAMSDATADERLTAGMQVFLECLTKAGSKVEKLDKSLIDHHIAELDFQISRQLDAVMHHDEFQAVESLWRGVKSLVDKTDFRQNVKIELLSMSKEDLRQDFEDCPEVIQSGLYKHTYIDEYDTPGGEPIAALISAYEFDASAQDVALLRNISKVSAAAHMPFIGSAGPKFFLKESMEDVAAIKDIGNYFDRAEYIKWKSFRDTDDARYIGLVMPRVLGRLPYGPDTVPVRSFNYVEEVKGPDHDKYLWTNASFAFASNMVRSFINNGWCVQIRGPQAGGAVQDLPIHLYDLGTGNQVKIPSEVMIPETREFEFANLGFIPLSYYKNRDYACFFSANSTQKPALYDTADATANSRINARLPYIFLLSRIAHYLQQNWAEMLETADNAFSRGANHLWLDLQWYIHQALTKSGQDTLAGIIAADLKGLLTRLSGLETLAFSDGTPFADDVTLNWIQQSVLDSTGGWGNDTPSAQMSPGNDDILALEPEAVALADSEGPDAALSWLQARPGITTVRQQWLLRLLMGRIAEQYGKNELAVHLFAELGERAGEVTLTNWEPELLFEVQTRHLKLLRLKASRSEADKTRLTPVMDQLLAGLIAVDPARAAVLCG